MTTADDKSQGPHLKGSSIAVRCLDHNKRSLTANVAIATTAAVCESFTDYGLTWLKNLRQVKGQSYREILSASMSSFVKKPFASSFYFVKEYCRGSRDLCVGTVPFVAALELKKYWFDDRISAHNTLYTDFAMNVFLGATLINSSEKLRIGSIMVGKDYSYNLAKNIFQRKEFVMRLFDGARATGIRDGASMTATICGLDQKIGQSCQKYSDQRTQAGKVVYENHYYIGKVLSAFTGTVISHPADILGTRAQMKAISGIKVEYKKIALELIEEGGYKIFARGFLTRYLSLLALGFFFDTYKNMAQNWYDKSRNPPASSPPSSPYSPKVITVDKKKARSHSDMSSVASSPVKVYDNSQFSCVYQRPQLRFFSSFFQKTSWFERKLGS